MPSTRPGTGTLPLMWIILAISVVSSVIIAILFATGFPEH